MTRQEFIDSVNDFDALFDFDRSEGFDYFEDVKSQDEFDEYIDECVIDWIRFDTWQYVRDRLCDIPEGYDWYDTYDDFTGLSDYDFDEYKQRLLEYLDENEYWDNGEEEDGNTPVPIGKPIYRPMAVQTDEPFDTEGFLNLITVPA